MTRRRSLHTISPSKPQRHSEPTTWRTVAEYVLIALFLGGAVGLALTMWDKSQERKAALAALPADIYFPGCDEVRQRGLAPLYAGEPGYRTGMDGDGDGLACE